MRWAYGLGGWVGSDSALSALREQLLELRDDLLHAPHVRVDPERPAEVGEGALGLVELQVDLPVTGEGPEVGRVSLHHLIAVLERLLVLAHEEVDGGPLVPGFREVGFSLDRLREGLHRGRAVAAAHLLQDGQRGPRAAHVRPTSLRNAASSSVATPSRLASSALEPASSPTTT